MARPGSKLPLLMVIVVVAGLLGAAGFMAMLLGDSGSSTATGPRTALNALDPNGFGSGSGNNRRPTNRTGNGTLDANGNPIAAGAEHGNGTGNGSGSSSGDGPNSGEFGNRGEGGVDVRINPYGSGSGNRSGARPPSNSPDDARRGPSGNYKSDGQTWRLEDLAGTEEKPKTEDEVTDFALVFTDGERRVAVVVQLFTPVTPMEMRVDGLYGGNQRLPTYAYNTDSAGQLVMPVAEALQFATDPNAPVVGVFVDDPNYEPLVRMVPVLTGEPTVITLVQAHFVEIEVRTEVGNAPLPDSEVELWRYDPTNLTDEPADVLRLRTDSTGKISSRIKPGRSYAFRVRKTGYATTPVQRFDCVARDEFYKLALYPGNFLSGTVTDINGQPVGGAKVVCQLNGNDGWGSDETITDDWGGFTVTRVPHSDFTSHVWVTVSKSGFATLVTQALTNDEDAHFVMHVDGGLTGVVLPPAESPLRGPVKIKATQTLYGKKEFTFDPFTANADGTFSISGLVQGEVTLVAENEFGERSEAVKVNYQPGTPAEGLSLQLLAAAGVFITVVSTEGDLPIPGLQAGINNWRGITDGAGTVHFKDLFPGEVNVAIIVDENPTESLVAAGDGEKYFLPAPVKVELKAGETTEVQFRLTRWTPPITEAQVTLHFSGDPTVSAPGQAKITTVFDNGGTEVRTETVDVIGGVGTLTLTIRSDGKTTVEFTHGDFKPVTIAPETLAELEEGAQFPIALERMASLRLQVVDRGDTQLFEVDVRLRRGNKDIARANTDGAGRVTFLNLEAGPVKLIAFKHGYRQAIFEFEIPVLTHFEPIVREDGSGLQVASLGNGTSADPAELKLTISNAGDIHVHVTDSMGNPAGNAHLYCARNQEENSPLQIFDLGKLDAQGGKVVRFHWDVWYQVWVVTESEIAYAYFYNDPNSPQYQLEIVLEPRATISGQALNGNGEELKEVEIRLVPESGPLVGSGNYFPVYTNKQGNWEIAVPASGTYSAVLPRVPNTQPVNGLVPGQQGVVIGQ